MKNMATLSSLILASVVILCGAQTSANAAVSVSNIYTTDIGGVIAGYAYPDDRYEVAQSFVTGQGNLTVESLVLRLDTAPGWTTEAFSPMRIGLYHDASGLPGQLVAMIGGAADAQYVQNSRVDVTFPATRPILLESDTRYWILASAQDIDGRFITGWFRAATTDEAGLPGWNIGNDGLVRHGGGPAARWSSTNGPLQFTMNAVPEPSTHVLLVFGALALGFRTRRQKPSC